MLQFIFGNSKFILLAFIYFSSVVSSIKLTVSKNTTGK